MKTKLCVEIKTLWEMEAEKSRKVLQVFTDQRGSTFLHPHVCEHFMFLS